MIHPHTGKILIITAPSGAGKTSITHHLMHAFPGKLAFSISAATRQPRGNEKDGVDYFFMSPETFQQKIRLESQEPAPPRHYIYALKNGPGDVFRQFGERAKSEPGWKYYEIDASHNPHITCPDVLMRLLGDIMAGK